jgi:hypothetical protein
MGHSSTNILDTLLVAMLGQGARNIKSAQYGQPVQERSFLKWSLCGKEEVSHLWRGV